MSYHLSAGPLALCHAKKTGTKAGKPKVNCFAQKLFDLALVLDKLMQLKRVTDGAWSQTI